MGSDVYDSCGQYVGVVSAQYDFYRMLADLGVDWQSICSKKYLPDDALLDERTSTLYVFEKKFQSTGGSVDEKIQTGPFKLYQYRKLADAAGIANVAYSYVLEAGYFSSMKFDDVREYYTDVFPEINMFYNDFGFDVLGL